MILLKNLINSFSIEVLIIILMISPFLKKREAKKFQKKILKKDKYNLINYNQNIVIVVFLPMDRWWLVIIKIVKKNGFI